MRVVIQRVSSAEVRVEGTVVGSIGLGLVLLVGIGRGDTGAELEWMARKCLGLKLFAQGEGTNWDTSVQELGADLLVVSQFTLYGDGRKGRRPSFDQAAPPAIAQPLYHQFVDYLRSSGLRVETGIFGATMTVSLTNEGPVTLILER